MNIDTDIGATSVWLRQGEIDGEKVHCEQYDRQKLISSLDVIRSFTVERDPQIFVPKLQETLSKCGVAIVFIKPFPKVPVFGASCWLNSTKALIQLSNRGTFSDKLWFTVFHELCHILEHSKKEIFVEIDDKTSAKPPEEVEADEFAAEKLIPREKLEKWLAQTHTLNKSSIISFANEIGIAPGIVVGRLQFIQKLHWSNLNDLKFQYKWN
jgi:HTH-type transcriptional regulator / antitoxin HigA